MGRTGSVWVGQVGSGRTTSGGWRWGGGKRVGVLFSLSTVRNRTRLNKTLTSWVV